MRLNKIAGQFSADYRCLPLLLHRVEINLLNYCTINPFFTAKDIIISFRACSCIIDYFILLSQYGEVQYFMLSTGAYGKVGFLMEYTWLLKRRSCCKGEKCGYHLGAVRKSSEVCFQCTHIQCFYLFLVVVVGVVVVYFVSAILRQLTDNEKMVLLKPVIN